jgi:hypothetical protein
MSDASACFDALEPFLVKFRVLAQLAPGEVIVIDESGHWTLMMASSWRSGLRAFWSFIRGQHLPPQRQSFLAAARETVRTVQRHVALLMRTAVFLRAMDSNGCLSREVVSRMPVADIEEIEAALHTLHSVCAHICDGLRGIAVMKASDPYGKDATFCSEIDVTIRDSLLHFLDSVHRRVGPDYASRVFPYLPPPVSGADTTKRYAWAPTGPVSGPTHAAISSTPSAPSAWGHAPGSAGAPAFYAHGPAREPPKPPPAVSWVPTAPATTARPNAAPLIPQPPAIPVDAKSGAKPIESKSSSTTPTASSSTASLPSEDEDTAKPVVKPATAWNTNQKTNVQAVAQAQASVTQSQTLPRAASQVAIAPTSRPSAQTSAPDLSRLRPPRDLL